MNSRFAVIVLLFFLSMQCVAQSDDAEFDRILAEAVRVLDNATNVKLSAEVRLVFAGEQDTVTYPYYMVAEREESLYPGCKMYGFNPRGEYTVYDGERLLEGYPETGRMTEYLRGSIPVQLFGSVFEFYSLLPLPVQGNLMQRVMKDSTCRQKTVSEGMMGKEPVYVLQVERSGNNEDIERNQLEIRVRKSDYVPVYIESKLDIEGMGQQYSDVALSFVALDTPIEEGLFSGATLPEDLELLKPPERNRACDRPLEAGNPAPEIIAPTVTGEVLRLSDFRGKVVVLDFFYTSCVPCRHAIPKLVELHEEFAGQDVVILGVNSHDNAANKRFLYLLESRHVPYPVLLPTRETDAAYHVYGYPTVVVIDRSGTIAATETGFSEEKSPPAWRSAIRKALEDGQ